jgi:inorganic pyrophosphatase
MEDHAASLLIVLASFTGMAFAALLFFIVSTTSLSLPKDGALSGVTSSPENDKLMATVNMIYGYIQNGAKAFLFAEYKICAIFIVCFGTLVFVLLSHPWQGAPPAEFDIGFWTTMSFVVGALTAIFSGYIGMMVAVYGNARCAVAAWKPGHHDELETEGLAYTEGPKDKKAWTACFNVAFRCGAVMGFSLTGMALLICFILVTVIKTVYGIDTTENAMKCMECISGFGLGGSCIAMFGRVGGGIFTKAADVGADLAGKVYNDFPEDDPRNPATIADNVGDNVGDVAGMGSDLFGSFAEATCAALVVGASSPELVQSGWAALMFPLCFSASGIFVCLIISFIATNIAPVKKEADVETCLKTQLFLTSVGMTVASYILVDACLPEEFQIADKFVTPLGSFVCINMGLWSGCAIGFITEYYTSFSYSPVQEVANSCETGAATNIIYGLALGYKSLVQPIILLSATVFVSFYLAGMYGVALAALGMLGTLATCLTIDVYGPVCDNAGGIAEMSGLPEWVRAKTDALDAAGNTTAAIGKGFAIGSAALVALALFGAFTTRAGLNVKTISVLSPTVFSWIFLGAMIPYAFTAMTMKSVGKAAMAMVKEVGKQLDEIDGLREGREGVKPDHDRCIKISTDASLDEMVAPAMLVILSPILCGTFFGCHAVCGLLTGSITSGVQLAISQSNSGGAWDNAKKYIERGRVSVNGEVQGKGTEVHKAAVCGDTVGDPLKDTSGPAINIVMKLQAIISLVFAAYFESINEGRGVFNLTV